MVDSFNLNTKKKLENVESFINNTKDTLVNAFGPNPLSTPAGIKVDLATSPDNETDNWALYLEICDLINHTSEGPKDAARAIRKKLLMSSGKMNNALNQTLNLLDTCVKNCGHRFHVFVAAREFIQDLVKVLSPKYNPSLAVQEKILNLIETWAVAFKSFPDLQGVVQINEELKTRGIESSSGEKNRTDAPIFTPPPSSSVYQSQTDFAGGDYTKTRFSQPPTYPPIHNGPQPSQGTDYSQRYQNQPPYLQQQQQQWRPPTGSAFAESFKNSSPYEEDDDEDDGPVATSTVHPSRPPTVPPPYDLDEKDMAKLRKELDVVRTNAQVLGDLLTQNPQGLDHEDRQLVEKLFSICRDMQSRIVELLDKVANEDFIGELLGVNDELNHVFVKYAKYARGMPTDEGEDPPASTFPPVPQRSTTSTSTATSTPFSEHEDVKSQKAHSTTSRMVPPVPDEKPLIDLGDEPNEGPSTMFERLDPFSTASVKNPNSAPSPVASVNKIPPVDIKENDLDNIDRWLHNKPYVPPPPEVADKNRDDKGVGTSHTTYDPAAINDDFEKFLLERTTTGTSATDPIPPENRASSSPNFERR